MRDLVLKYKTKFDELSVREQVMVSAGVFVLLGVVWFQYLYDPLYLQTKETSSELQSLKSAIAKISDKRSKLISRKASDPHQGLRKRITVVNNNLDKINTVLDDKFHALVEPKKMAEVLESVLKQHSSLTLISVKSLPAEAIITNKEPVKEVGSSRAKTKVEASRAKTKVEIYRHGLQIELKGNYLAVLKYLQTLEGLDWEFYWDAVTFEVIDYPQANIYITVYTLSLRDSWIGV